MDADEETLLRRERRVLGDFFPGLVERLERLGGSFLPVQRPPSLRYFRAEDKRVLKTSVAFRVREPAVCVAIWLTLEITPTSRTIVEHSYHLGPGLTGEYILRLCENSIQKHHFHRRGWEAVYQGGHIPASKADPPLSKDPLKFLDEVEHFIQTNQIRIQVNK